MGLVVGVVSMSGRGGMRSEDTQLGTLRLQWEQLGSNQNTPDTLKAEDGIVFFLGSARIDGEEETRFL